MGQGQGQIVDIPGVGQVEFPADLPEDALNAAVKKLHDEAVTPPSFATAGMEKPSSLAEAAPPNQGTEFLKHAAQGINLPGMAKDAYHAVTNPRETYNGLVDQSAHNFSEFDRLVRAKDPVHAEMHLASALFPPFNMVTGPGDALREGRTGEGLGDAVATGLQGAILPKVSPAVRKISPMAKTAARAVVRTGAGLPEEAFSITGGAAGLMTGDPLKAAEGYVGGQKVHKLLGKLNTRINPPGSASTLGLTDDAAVAARARAAQTPVGPRPMDISGRVQSPPAVPGAGTRIPPVSPGEDLGMFSDDAIAARARAAQAPFGPRPTEVGSGNRPPIGRTSSAPDIRDELGLTREDAIAARTAETSAGPASVSRMRSPAPLARPGESVTPEDMLGLSSPDAVAARARAAQEPTGPRPTDVGSNNRPPMGRTAATPTKPSVMTGKPLRAEESAEGPAAEGKKPATPRPVKPTKGATPGAEKKMAYQEELFDQNGWPDERAEPPVPRNTGAPVAETSAPVKPRSVTTGKTTGKGPSTSKAARGRASGNSPTDDAVIERELANGKTQAEAEAIMAAEKQARHFGYRVRSIK